MTKMTGLGSGWSHTGPLQSKPAVQPKPGTPAREPGAAPKPSAGGTQPLAMPKPASALSLASAKPTSGNPKGIPQYYENSCMTVEAMAAWQDKDPKGFQQALDDFSAGKPFMMPNGLKHMFTPDQLADAKAAAEDAVGSKGSKQDQKMAMMQHFMNFDGDRAGNLSTFKMIMGNIGMEPFVADAKPADDKAAFDALMKKQGQVPVVLDQGKTGHAVTVKKQGDRYVVEQGNVPLKDDDGKPLSYSWNELADAMANGELKDKNVGHNGTTTRKKSTPTVGTRAPAPVVTEPPIDDFGW